MYFVFKGKQLLGHTDNKKIIKMFMKERKTGYRVEEIEDRYLNKSITDDIEFHSKTLDYYEHYNRVMTEHELAEIYGFVDEQLFQILHHLKEIREELKYVRLNNVELKIVLSYIDLVEMIRDDIGGESAVNLADYFDMDSIIDLIIKNT